MIILEDLDLNLEYVEVTYLVFNYALKNIILYIFFFRVASMIKIIYLYNR